MGAVGTIATLAAAGVVVFVGWEIYKRVKNIPEDPWPFAQKAMPCSACARSRRYQYSLDY